MGNIFLISDLHFGQESMCKFLRQDGMKLRPYNSAEEMDEDLIAKWNSVVRQDDTIYVLGDIAMRKNHIATFSRLQGNKRLVHGNHDIFETKEYMKYFQRIYGVKVLEDMILTHIPIHPDSLTKRYNTNVHGHTHANSVLLNGVIDSKYFCVSVEQIGFTPIEIGELRKKIKERKELFPPIYTCFQKQAD